MSNERSTSFFIGQEDEIKRLNIFTGKEKGDYELSAVLTHLTMVGNKWKTKD
jgi:hypothetical protein